MNSTDMVRTRQCNGYGSGPISFGTINYQLDPVPGSLCEHEIHQASRRGHNRSTFTFRYVTTDLIEQVVHQRAAIPL